VPGGEVSAPAAEKAFPVGGERFPGGENSDLVPSEGSPVAVDINPVAAAGLFCEPDRDPRFRESDPAQPDRLDYEQERGWQSPERPRRERASDARRPERLRLEQERPRWGPEGDAREREGRSTGRVEGMSCFGSIQELRKAALAEPGQVLHPGRAGLRDRRLERRPLLAARRRQEQRLSSGRNSRDRRSRRSGGRTPSASGSARRVLRGRRTAHGRAGCGDRRGGRPRPDHGGSARPSPLPPSRRARSR
jgi:hypothetical protein